MTRARRTTTVALATALLCVAGTIRSHTQEYSIGPIEIAQPWTRATGPGSPTAVGYMRIRNRGTAPDRLVGGSTPMARAVEAHVTTITPEGVMRMRPVEGGIAIPAGAAVALEPGNDIHLMLVAPSRPFRPGDRIPLALVFERAGRVEIQLEVQAAGARAPTPDRGGATGGHEAHAGTTGEQR